MRESYEKTSLQVLARTPVVIEIRLVLLKDDIINDLTDESETHSVASEELPCTLARPVSSRNPNPEPTTVTLCAPVEAVLDRLELLTRVPSTEKANVMEFDCSPVVKIDIREA